MEGIEHFKFWWVCGLKFLLFFGVSYGVWGVRFGFGFRLSGVQCLRLGLRDFRDQGGGRMVETIRIVSETSG